MGVRHGILSIALLVVLTGTTARARPLEIAAPGPGTMGLATLDGALWTIDRTTHRLYEVDPATGAERRTIESPCREPGGLAAGDGALWCSDLLQNVIHRIDPATGRATARLEAPCSFPGGMAWRDGHLWVVCPYARKIAVTDPGDGTAVRWLPAPHKRITALGDGGSYVLAADGQHDEIYLLDPSGGAIWAALPSPGPFPSGLARIGDRIWVADYQTDRIYGGRTAEQPPVTTSDERREHVVYRHVVTNRGPGSIYGLEVAVAVPDSRPNQEILAIHALPAAVAPVERRDAHGQRFWLYRVPELAEDQEMTFGFRADVELRKARWFVDPEKLDEAGTIPKDVRDLYLRDQSKYALHDPLVRGTVQRVVGDEKNPYLRFQRLYHYVIDNMEYALAGGWNAAPLLLERKTGSCSEYTFLLISLLRSAGIPARYVGSVVVRGDDASVDHVFHRWAEVYFAGIGWVPVDANKGDADWPVEQFEGIGLLDARYLITTQSGGDSPELGWSYNSEARWSQTGDTLVEERKLAEWEPLEPASETSEDTIPAGNGMCQ